MLVFSLVLAAAGPVVVVGSGDIDGTATVLSTVTLQGELSARCTVTHQRGLVPPGTLVDAHTVALTLSVGSTRAGAVVVVDLRDCSTRTLLDEVIANQAVVVVDDQLIAVRQLDADGSGATFDVVAVPLLGGPSEVLASRQALWVSPARGARSRSALRFLVGEGAGPHDGTFHIDALDHGDFKVDSTLGRGVFRSAVVVGGGVLLEAEHGGTAALRDGDSKVLVRGLPGLSPVSNGGSWAASTGRKDGSVVVDGVERSSGRAGVARPQALGAKGDVVVVVAWLDRGASLPGELWAVLPTVKGKPQSTRLLPPRARTAVMVYGVTQ